jgi:tetratricopeptide (TPR) repeat protein
LQPIAVVILSEPIFLAAQPMTFCTHHVLRSRGCGITAVRCCAVLLLSAVLGGCQMFRQQGPVPKQVAEARQLSQRGLNAMEKGDVASAESLLGEAVKVCPQDLDARRQYAEALVQRGEPQLALEHLMKALLQSPDDTQLAVRAGEIQLSLGRLDDAKQMANQVLDLTPSEPRAWALRARVEKAAGDYDRALADFHHALQYHRDDRDVLLETAELYRLLNRPQRALSTLTCLRETYGPFEEPQEVLYLQGLALEALARNDDAADVLTLAIDRGPPSAELLYRLAEAQAAADHAQAADRALEQALAIDPTHGPSRNLRSKIEVASRPVGQMFP